MVTTSPSLPTHAISKINTALLSVSDKTGIVALARTLHDHSITLLSTGGTLALLREHGIPAVAIADYTGFPEIMAGRVKTLHPKIHGGILGRPDQDEAVMATHGITAIDLVVVNLYPFAQTIAQPDVTLATAIDTIDIGGPTMVRAAAKNYHHTTVMVDNNDYHRVLSALASPAQGIDLSLRFELAVKAFAHTAHYDTAIADYLGSVPDTDTTAAQTTASGSDVFPETFRPTFIKSQALRYGENPHQPAALYREQHTPNGTVMTAQQQQGKALSYNNIADADAALTCVQAFKQPTCVIVKHGNPCGVASASTLAAAYDRAYTADPTSAFGGVIAGNRPLDHATAAQIIAHQFVEVIIVPAIEPAALAVLQDKPNVRLLTCGQPSEPAPLYWDYHRIHGGLLVQMADVQPVAPSDWQVVTERAPSEQTLADLQFAWTVCQHVKSNAIVYARAQQTVGIGAGQMSRVDSTRLASLKAADQNHTVQGAVMASDAFFPFRDGIDTAAKAGITAVIQPGGSIRDQEVIAAANAADMAMVFTCRRHFRH